MSYLGFFRPEKYWLVCAGLLANHLFSSNLIFLSGGGMSGMFCEYIPTLTSPISRQWTGIGRPDLNEAKPGLSPKNKTRDTEKSSKFKSNQSAKNWNSANSC
jgi:hypothetical protein